MDILLEDLENFVCKSQQISPLHLIINSILIENTATCNYSKVKTLLQIMHKDNIKVLSFAIKLACINKDMVMIYSQFFDYSTLEKGRISIHLYVTNDFRQTQYIPIDKKYWDELPYIFVEIPKNASCSITWETGRIYSMGHLLARYYPISYRNKLKCIVRNPYDRLVSAFLFIMSGGFGQKEYKELSIKYNKYNDMVLNFQYWVLNELMEEWTIVHETTYTDYNGEYEMCISQYEFLSDGNGKLLVDMDNIGKYENLSVDCERLFGITLNLKLNSRNKGRWQSFYNDKTKDRVYELYKKDFETFEYCSSIALP